MHRRYGAAHCAAVCAVTSSAILALTLPTFAQQSTSSPLASAAAERYRYPDGGRVQTQYDSTNEGVVLPPARSTGRAAAAGLAAGAKIQANLPDGFSLRGGSTSYLPPRAPTPSGAAPANVTAAPATDSSEKFVTLFPVAYQGVPLSKESDYLSVVNGEGRLLVTRKRGLPQQVDATQPTVAAVDAVGAARQAAGQTFSSIDPEKIKPELQIWVDDQQHGNLAW